ncbi:hypothetical protein FRB96_008233 [Tulasnella sp. 330]|nr:hypothetical protein FRB96_008233 [Tulasnella sp. 330]
MTNWSDPSTIASQAEKFNEIVVAFLGLLTWEVLITLWFDFDVITRRRAFKWPMIIYWTSKYTMLFGIVGVVIAQNATTKLNCEALYVFNQLFGNIAIGTASTLLMIRTIAVWSRHRMIMYPFILLSLGQWAVLLHSVVTVSAAWDDVAMACTIKSSPTVNLQVLYLYTMIFDFFVLIATSIGLYRIADKQTPGNQLWSMLFQDGLAYFLTVIFVLADLNPIMNVIATVPAATVATIVSCRAFLKLMVYNECVLLHEHAIPRLRSSLMYHNHLYSAPLSNMAMSGHRPGGPVVNRTIRQAGLQAFTNPGGGARSEIRSNAGVRIQMDTFISHEGIPEESNVNFDDGDDAESQHEKATLPYTTDRASSEDFADEKPNLKSFMPRVTIQEPV